LKLFLAEKKGWMDFLLKPSLLLVEGEVLKSALLVYQALSPLLQYERPV